MMWFGIAQKGDSGKKRGNLETRSLEEVRIATCTL
jgi:hypothetical protein